MSFFWDGCILGTFFKTFWRSVGGVLEVRASRFALGPFLFRRVGFLGLVVQPAPGLDHLPSKMVEPAHTVVQPCTPSQDVHQFPLMFMDFH